MLIDESHRKTSSQYQISNPMQLTFKLWIPKGAYSNSEPQSNAPESTGGMVSHITATINSSSHAK